MIRKALPALAILIAALIVSACPAPGPPERVEITLPIGEVDAGKQAFVSLGCPSCHIVSGVEGLPQPAVGEKAVDLAVSVRGLSRSAILTSIVAPAHVDSQSTELWTEWEEGQRVWLGPGQQVTEAEEAPKRTVLRMTDYSHVMTVKQLSDLAAFVQSVAAEK